jgi:SAM-dependent methyltransferase/uncharacterized protein YbaR (Trm112 family)
MQTNLTDPKAAWSLLRCPQCRKPLSLCDDKLYCTGQHGATSFPIVNGVPVVINELNSLFTRADFASDNTANNHAPESFSRRLDKWLPSLSRNLASKRTYRGFAQSLLEQASNPLVLVVGGSILGKGMESLASEPRIRLIETDVCFGPRTQVICDAHDLPFEDGTFDGVVAQAVLQYVVDPARCVQEIERVLKPGGLVYVESAFMQQVVQGRYDFTRFTHLGLRRLFRNFREIESGPATGTGMALAWACQFFLLSLVTTRWARRVMYGFARLTLFWLKYFDAALVRHPGVYDAASGFFFMGQKSGEAISDRELLALYRGAQ